ncbi:uncharacterized protein HGUI_03323 [Hanseniaspora guilliermondii]|uniref:Mitochondrial import receptor subunit TOM70 n=1 Tax=Hanseniaspora guilliermondii TaxID=56406 RepID=A0A1L0B7Q5_9ASCO|nr:uncharacterized protein HGUI_03323 [Hanseniaspora guilliermondii]
MSEENNTVTFFTKHKTAIITTAVCLGVAVTTAYSIYNNKQPNTTPSSDNSIKKKKKKENQKLKKQQEKEAIISTHSIEKYGLKFMPNSTAVDVTGLSEQERKQKAAKIKLDANALFKENQFKDAILYYTWAIQLYPDEVYYSNRSVCFLKLNQFEKAIKDCTSALEKKPMYPKCLLRRANCYESLGKYEDAVFDLSCLVLMEYEPQTVQALLEKNQDLASDEAMTEAIKNQPHVLANFSDIASFFSTLTSLKKNAKIINDKHLNEIIDLLYGETAEDIIKCDELISSYVQDDGQKMSSFSNVVKCYIYAIASSLTFFKVLPQLSMEYIEKSLSYEKNAFNLVMYALINSENSPSSKDASELFNEAIEIDQNDASALYHKAQFLAMVDETQLKAISNLFIQVLEIDETFIFAEIQLCLLAYKQNPESQDYMTRFSSLIRKYPDNAQVRVCYAEVLAMKPENINEAVAQLESVLSNTKIPGLEKVGAMVLRVHTYLSDPKTAMGDLAFANTLLKDAYDLDKTNYKVLNCIGQVKLQNPATVNEGLELLTKAIDYTQGPLEKKQLIRLVQMSRLQFKLIQHPTWGPLFIETTQRAM